MLFKKYYYKIVRCIEFINEKGNIEVIRHSCCIPYFNILSVRYNIYEWSIGRDLFVFDSDIDKLKKLSDALSVSQSVVDCINEDLDESDKVRIELWKCIIGNSEYIDTSLMKPVHVFLKQPEVCRDKLQLAKNSKIYKNQLVTDGVKLLELIYISVEDKIIFNKRIRNV